MQISHFKLAARGLWGQAADLLARLDEARAAGLDITADVYPYEYWQSTMTVLFPERDFADREAARYALEELVAPEGMLIGRFEADTTLEGKTLAQIAEERGTDAVTTYLDLIAESRAGRESGRGGESIVATSMTFDDIATLMSWPHTNVSSDGGLRGAHPRGFGAYPRVLGRYVREEGRLGLEEAVRKMTGLAAAHMGLSGRGVLAVGAPADMVLFDPATVIDRSTTAEPHLTAEGIERVWVAGVVVYEDGAVTGATPGRCFGGISPGGGGPRRPVWRAYLSTLHRLHIHELADPEVRQFTPEAAGLDAAEGQPRVGLHEVVHEA